MNKIITRNWVNPQIKIFPTLNSNSSIEYSTFSLYVDKWKYLLVTKYNAKPNLTFGFTVSITDIRYLSLFFAVCELGMQFVVYQRPNKPSDLKNYKIDIFKPIDLMVYDDVNYNDDIVKAFISEFSSQSFDIKEIDELQMDTLSLDEFNKISQEIFATPSSNLLLTTSSGTTSVPKLIKHSHEFFYDLCSRNCSVMNFAQEDIILHTRNLHHGSSVGVFFLPSLRSSQNHYSLNFQEEDCLPLVQALSSKNITKILVSNNSIIDSILKIMLEKDIKLKQLTIFNLSFLKNEWIYYCKEKYLNSIQSIFGCNETSGPIFLPYINELTDISLFDNKNMGEELDNFYSVNIDNSALNVNLASYDKRVSTNDNFKITNKNYFYLGRDNLFRIQDREIDFSKLQKFIKLKISSDHELIFDQEEEQIYLALFDAKDNVDLKILNLEIEKAFDDSYKISNCRILNKHAYMYGIKLDFEELRKFFRYWKRNVT